MPRPQVGGGTAFAIIAATFALVTTGGTLPIPLYRLWGEQMEFGAETTTWVFAIYVVGTLLALIVFGGLSDQIGRRPLAFAALGVTIASTLCFVYAGNVTMLLIGRFLSGIAVGLFSSAGTAALKDIYPGTDAAIPAMVSTAANMGGLGLGPLVAGAFAQFLPNPTVLVFVVFGALVVLVTVLTAFVVETDPPDPDHTFRWAPRVGVPREARSTYWRSAVAVLPPFTLLGLFSSLTPRFIHDSLGIDNLFVAGLATFVLFEVGVAAQLLFREREPRWSILVGLPLLMVALGLVLAGFLLPNTVLFGLGTVIGGVGAGLSFMGGMSQLSAAVPHDSHAQSVASYLIAAQIGLAVPILSIGVLTRSMELPAATTIVVGVVLAIAVVGLVVNARRGRQRAAEG